VLLEVPGFRLEVSLVWLQSNQGEVQERVYNTVLYSGSATMPDDVSLRMKVLASRGLPQASEAMRGPTSTSNVVIPQFVLWGDTPRGAKLAQLVESGVTDFVDVRSAAESSGSSVENSRIHQFDLHAHMSTSSAATVAKFIKSLLVNVLAHHGVMYVHCKDGGSLSGVFCAAVLCVVYEVSSLKAMSIMSQLHSCRVAPENIHQLFTPAQKAFLRDVAADTSPLPLIDFNTQHSTQTELSPGESQAQAVQGVGQRGSRFEHTTGGGGGKTSVNLFAESVEPAASSQRRHRRASVTGRTVTARHLAPSEAPGSHPPVSQGAVPGPTVTPAHLDPTQLAAVPLIRPPVSAPTATICLVRTSALHMWGIVHAGPLIRYIIRDTPAARAGMHAAQVILSVDDVSFGAKDQLEWMTEDRLRVWIVVSDGSGSPLLGPSAAVGASPKSSNVSVASSMPQTPSNVARDVPMFNLRTDRRSIAGPTPTTNWVVPQLALCGPLPNPNQPKTFLPLVKEGFDIFVSLLQNPDTPSQTYVQAYEESARRKVTVWTLPLQDGVGLEQAQVAPFMELVGTVVDAVREQRKIYIHCHNGHGRTGMFVSALLAELYGLSGMRAVNFCDSLHSCRVETEDASSPATQEQRLCVVSLIVRR